MKKLISIICLATSCFVFSQKFYKKISNKNVNQERLNIGKKFALEFINKCENRDYSRFQNFIIDKRFTKLNDSIKESCEKINRIDGKVEIKGFNSSYSNNYTKDFAPQELFIFDIETEKNPKAKYVSIWIYKDQNVISGLWFSTEKPLTRKNKAKKNKL